jgi:hypothetical protein
MPTYSEASVENARRHSRIIRDTPPTALSLAQDKVNRQRAAEAAEEIIQKFPQVHALLLSAYEVWGAWEIEIFDIFDKNRVSIQDQEEIRRFITTEAISYSEFIRPFEIHSGEVVTLRELIAAHKEDRAVTYGMLEDVSSNLGLQTRTRLVPSTIFAIQLAENETYKGFSPKYRAQRNSEQQLMNILELQDAIARAGMNLRIGDPHLEQAPNGDLVSMTVLVNGALSDGMAVRKLLLGDWLVVEPLVGNPLGEVMTNEQFRVFASS